MISGDRADTRAAAPLTDAIPWLALGFLVLVAAVARGIGLNGGLWIDEIYSLVRSFRSPVGSILTEYWGDNHHPLYALLAHVTRGIFGESAWSVRLPAFLFGVGAIPALYALARRLVRQREA
ncbi:MAG TPA: glycosyltransferase family 39 protein, partial [Burkholderiales bacterium]|nr:glycosyltransferase family 39 protein [Burkholderiales bacterium]